MEAMCPDQEAELDRLLDRYKVSDDPSLRLELKNLIDEFINEAWHRGWKEGEVDPILPTE